MTNKKPEIRVITADVTEDQDTIIWNTLSAIFHSMRDYPYGVIRRRRTICCLDYGNIVDDYYYLHTSKTKSKLWKYLRKYIIRVLPYHNLVLEAKQRNGGSSMCIELSNTDFLNAVQEEFGKLTFLSNITIKLIKG